MSSCRSWGRSCPLPSPTQDNRHRPMASANQPPQPPPPRASRILHPTGVQAVTVSRWSDPRPATRTRSGAHCKPIRRPASRVPRKKQDLIGVSLRTFFRAERRATNQPKRKQDLIGVSLRLFCHATPQETNSECPQKNQFDERLFDWMVTTYGEKLETQYKMQIVPGMARCLCPVGMARGTRHALNFILFQ